MLVRTLPEPFPRDIVGRLERRRGGLGDAIRDGSDRLHPAVCGFELSVWITEEDVRAGSGSRLVWK